MFKELTWLLVYTALPLRTTLSLVNNFSFLVRLSSGVISLTWLNTHKDLYGPPIPTTPASHTHVGIDVIIMELWAAGQSKQIQMASPWSRAPDKWARQYPHSTVLEEWRQYLLKVKDSGVWEDWDREVWEDTEVYKDTDRCLGRIVSKEKIRPM